jgi:aldose 1-epimerase
MTVSNFGEIDGVAVREIRLRADSGAEASILSFGATLRDLLVPLAGGGRRRTILGYETLDGYRRGHSYFGATCGRVANRIAGGQFSLDGKPHQVSLNENGRTHLHGGLRGFSHHLWEIADHAADRVMLRRVSPDGEEGYPGRVEVFCLYRLTSPATLRMEFTATTEAATLINMVNHAYFTLAEDQPIWGHQMRLAADFYTPVDAALIPTGEIRAVADTPYDLGRFRSIGMGADATPFDYDTNFVLQAPAPATDDSGTGALIAASVVSPGRDLQLDVVTGEPGLQFYSGAGIQARAPGFEGAGFEGAGIGGQRHFPHAGFCLEAQRFPDAVHHRHFPSTVLRPGEIYRQTTEYRFSMPSAS